MRSARPKVLHAVAGQSLLAHVLDAVRKAGGTMTAVVIGPGAEAVAAEARRVAGRDIFVQAERRGTAHAVLAAGARRARRRRCSHHFGDTPMIRPQTLARCARRGRGDRGARLSPADPTGYGRLVLEGGELIAIRESSTPAWRNARSICATAADGARRPDGAYDPGADRQR